MSERLDALARRVGRDPFFLAAALAAYAQSERLDDHGLARALDCAPATLTPLRLCRRPRPEPGAFRADVERIAGHFGLDTAALAQLVRRADALAGLRDAAVGVGRDDAGLLMAARDRDDDKPPDGDEGGQP
ncbi:MAG TPA: hypothetical protein VFW96_09830 [Thermomicrobiales bacterium]|nr:hypothetical protein [Thermomicrobiales bacterium]